MFEGRRQTCWKLNLSTQACKSIKASTTSMFSCEGFKMEESRKRGIAPKIYGNCFKFSRNIVAYNKPRVSGSKFWDNPGLVSPSILKISQNQKRKVGRPFCFNIETLYLQYTMCTPDRSRSPNPDSQGTLELYLWVVLRGETHMEMVLQISSQGVPMAAAKDPWQEQMNMKQHGWVELKKQNTPTICCRKCISLSLHRLPEEFSCRKFIYIWLLNWLMFGLCTL